MWLAGIALLMVLTVLAWGYAGAHDRHRAFAVFLIASSPPTSSGAGWPCSMHGRTSLRTARRSLDGRA